MCNGDQALTNRQRCFIDFINERLMPTIPTK